MNEWTARFDAALASTEPAARLGEFACELKAEGVSQLTLYRFYAGRFVALDGDDPRSDAVADVMDRIWSGGWGGPGDLFEVGLTNAMLREVDARNADDDPQPAWFGGDV